jgi:hypothetical protein
MVPSWSFPLIGQVTRNNRQVVNAVIPMQNPQNIYVTTFQLSPIAMIIAKPPLDAAGWVLCAPSLQWQVSAIR